MLSPVPTITTAPSSKLLSTASLASEKDLRLNDGLAAMRLAAMALSVRYRTTSESRPVDAVLGDQPLDETARSGDQRAEGDTATISREASARNRRASNGDSLSSDEQRVVRELEQRDRQVRTHEEAHKGAAGELYRGGPYYEYQTGPDGKRYAVGGSVRIDTTPGRTPEETLSKAAKIRRAALAPADPSSTDRSVAAKADRMASDARREMLQDQLDDRRSSTPEPTSLEPASNAEPSDPTSTQDSSLTPEQASQPAPADNAPEPPPPAPPVDPSGAVSGLESPNDPPTGIDLFA